MTLQRRPPALVRVKMSTAVPSGMFPNGDWAMRAGMGAWAWGRGGRFRADDPAIIGEAGPRSTKNRSAPRRLPLEILLDLLQRLSLRLGQEEGGRHEIDHGEAGEE